MNTALPAPASTWRIAKRCPVCHGSHVRDAVAVPWDDFKKAHKSSISGTPIRIQLSAESAAGSSFNPESPSILDGILDQFFRFRTMVLIVFAWGLWMSVRLSGQPQQPLPAVTGTFDWRVLVIGIVALALLLMIIRLVAIRTSGSESMKLWLWCPDQGKAFRLIVYGGPGNSVGQVWCDTEPSAVFPLNWLQQLLSDLRQGLVKLLTWPIGPDKPKELPGGAVGLIAYLVVLAGVLWGAQYVGRWIGLRGLQEIGLRVDSPWVLDLLCGALLGGGLAFLAAAWARHKGSLSRRQQMMTNAASQISAFGFTQALVAILIFVCVAVLGEVMFRGLLVQWWAGRWGIWLAIVGSSIVYGLLFIRMAGSTPLAILATALQGAWFALAFFQSGALWIGIGFNTFWNIVFDLGFGFPVSGQVISVKRIHQPIGSDRLMTGGAFGPEGAFPGLVAILLAFLALPFLKYLP